MATIQRVGNEYMIPLNDEIIKQLEICEGDIVLLLAKDGVLECKFSRVGFTDAEIDAAIDHFHARYDAAMKRLAE